MVNERVRKKLIEIAKAKGKIYYSELNVSCELGINFEGDAGGKEIGKILGDISKDEFSHGRPPISVLVGLKTKPVFTPSDGFFDLIDDEIGNIRKPNETNDQLRNRLMNWAYDYWEKNDS